MKRTSSIRFLHNPRNCFHFSRYFSGGREVDASNYAEASDKKD